MSEVYRHQHSGLADNAMGGSLRYRDTCLLWIKCDQDGRCSSVEWHTPLGEICYIQ
ncbi:hypothetical protein DPMN_030510 [Dreissena polymorpha]|uniref:Uncharacterized protein n=1 Tax=Dreissena polymorpha TaxID=45954 RepID=A0A9D4M114_DREPO|nr:hypothetical protein DPMN_030510 [Dreissena polymorpha]